MIRIYPSEPGADELSLLAFLIAMAKNPQVWFCAEQLPEAECKALIATLENEMQELMS